MVDEPAPIRHVWRTGDTLSALAAENGLAHWTRIWNDDANSDLRTRRVTPDQIQPGDEVAIPQPQEGQDAGATEQEHRFEALGVPPTAVRFIDDRGQTVDPNAAVLNNLQVSWFVTTQDLPEDWWRSSTDRRNFKIEVSDLGEQGDTIPSDRCRLEVLKPRLDDQGQPVRDTNNDIEYESFATPRTLDVELRLVPNSNPRIFRSHYLRLVVDEADKESKDEQTLLTDHDPDDLRIEILDQTVRVTYTSSEDEPVAAFATVGQDEQRFRVAVNIVRNEPGGAAPIGISRQDVHRAIRCWMRRTYAQTNMAPELVEFGDLPEGCPDGAVEPRSNTNPRETGSLSTDAPGIRFVDPPRNLVGFYTNGRGGARADGELSFRVQVEGVAGEHTYRYRPANRGEAPEVAARNFDQQVRADGFLTLVQVNPVAFNRAESADLVIWDSNRRRVTIDRVRTADSGLQASASHVQPNGGFATAMGEVWVNVGSLGQRNLCHNYRSGTDRVDVFVIERFRDPAGWVMYGWAQIEQQRVGADYRGVDPVRMTCYVRAFTTARDDERAHVPSHEMGHLLIDMEHLSGTSREMMCAQASPPENQVNSRKRISDRELPSRESQPGGSQQVQINPNRDARTRQPGVIRPWDPWTTYTVRPAD